MVTINPNSLAALEKINKAGATRVTDKVELFKELVRAGKTPNEAKKIVIERFNLQRGKATGTPKWMTRGKQELIAEGFDYKDSPRGPANVGGRKKAQTKRSAILENLDERVKRTKQKTGLGKQYELAHTANIFQAKKLGIDYPIDALAIQTQNVNNKVAEALNDELKPLYRKQLKLFNKMKRKNTPSLMKQMDKINFQIGELVATGGSQGSVAANVLKPIIVDPDTVKGKILDLGFDTSTEIMAEPGATTKAVAGSADDLFARASVESRIENVEKKLVDNFAQKVKSVPGGCRVVVTKALGGPIDKCEVIIKADPEKAAAKLNNAITATKGPLKDLKEDSQKLIRLYRGEGFNLRTGPSIKEMAKTFGVSEAEAKKKLLSGQWFTSDPVAAASYTNKLGKTKFVDVTPKEFMDFKRYVDRVNKTKSLSGGERFAVNTGDKLSIIPRYKLKEFEKADKLKSQRNIFKDFTTKSGYVDRPEGVLSYDSVKGGFVDPAQPDKVVTQSDIKQYAIDNPMEVKVGEPAKLPKPNKSVLKTVGKTLAAVGAPLPTALLDGYFINKQVEEGKSTAEIASNPLNWLGLATMSPLTKAAGLADKSGKLSSVLRLGLNPGTISGISRFAGLPGLAISTAVTAYDQYNKYKNQEGFIYKLFNKEES